MKTLRDYSGLAIRFTEERLHHILEHPEMHGMAGAIQETLASPQRVMQSLSDRKARLYYRFYIGTKVGNKFLCVVVKVKNDDAFVLTAYLTDAVKRGVMVWPKKS